MSHVMVKRTLLDKREHDAASKLRRRTSVSFAPLPPSPFNRSTSAPSTCMLERRKSKSAHLKSKGFRKDYSIGETTRSSSHMIITPTAELAFQVVSSLKKHDFAFIKRSDGSYAYAILAFRSLEPSNDRSNTSDSLEEYMAFVVSGTGSIKMLKKEHWSDFIRLASMDGSDPLPALTRRKRGKSQQQINHKNDWVPPSIISFIPTNSGADDGLSLLDHKSW